MDRDSFEAQFRQAQKLEAVGKLTGGIAHDFNNILTVIQGSLELLALDKPNDSEVQKRTGDALHATQQAAVLTTRLLSFSRKQMLNPSRINLQEMTKRLAEFLRPSLGELYDLRVAVPSDIRTFRVDGAHLESALVNLVINARDAQEEGGVIHLKAAHHTLTMAQARDINVQGAEDLYLDIDSQDFVALSVCDTGIGMSEEVRSNAIDPFFTTKAVGKGSGLGLSMVYGFVSQSHGLLSIESSLGKGTTVTMFFPVVSAEPSDHAISQ